MGFEGWWRDQCVTRTSRRSLRRGEGARTFFAVADGVDPDEEFNDEEAIVGDGEVSFQT